MMEDNLKVNGLMIKCMVMESLHGLMVKVTKANMLKMRSKEKEDSIMEMVHFIRAIGLKADNMEEESLEIKTVKFMRDDMNMVN